MKYYKATFSGRFEIRYSSMQDETETKHPSSEAYTEMRNRFDALADFLQRAGLYLYLNSDENLEISQDEWMTLP